MRFNVTFEQAIGNIRAVRPLSIEARVIALKYYIWRIISRHFANGNTQKYGYKENKADYDQWKKRNFGNLPQLVLSGELKKAAENATVTKDGKIIFNVPMYGMYQIDLGRDWASPSDEEIKEIKGVFRRTLMRLVRERVSRNSIKK